MASTAVRKQLLQLQAELATLRAPRNPIVDHLRHDPSRIMLDAGLTPDPWQCELLRTPHQRTLLLCSRQAGKSQTCAGLALLTALTEPGSLILLLSPSQRQSTELFRKVLDLWQRLGRPVVNAKTRENATRLELANGSRIESLPGTESTVRSFSAVRLLVVDEAARVSDPLYLAIRPMLAVSRGRLVALTTPFGKRGWFYEAWESGANWHRIKVTADHCPRIDAEFLAEERIALGDLWFDQEYRVIFGDTITCLFREEDIAACLKPDMEPFAFNFS